MNTTTQPGPLEVRSNDGLGSVEPERASTCGLTECAGKPMCVRCARIADMDALCQLLPEGAAWGDPLTPELLRAVLASPRQVEFRRLYADW